MVSVHEMVRCDIGNVVISVLADDPSQKHLLELPLAFQDFLTHHRPDVKLFVRRLETPVGLRAPIPLSRTAMCVSGKPDIRRYWREEIHRHAEIATCLDRAGYHGPADLCIPLKDGLLVAAFQQSKAFLFLLSPGQSGVEGDAYFASTTNALMALLSFCVSSHGGALVHGTGLHFAGKGFLFVSQSGGGKTTLSQSVQPGTVLADDGIAVRRKVDGWQIYPTPFRQRTAGDVMLRAWCHRPVDLTALLFLEKGEETVLLPVHRPEILAQLLNAHTHFACWFPPEVRVRLFDFWHSLSVDLPIFRFQWKKGDRLSVHLAKFT